MLLKLELIKQYTIKFVEEFSMTMYLTMASATHLLAEMWYLHFLSMHSKMFGIVEISYTVRNILGKLRITKMIVTVIMILAILISEDILTLAIDLCRDTIKILELSTNRIPIGMMQLVERGWNTW